MQNKFNATESNFIKSFRELRKLPLTLTEVNVLELILSYQTKGLEFYESDKSIGNYVMIEETSSKRLIAKLVKKGYITTVTTSNQGKGYGGKTRKIRVNLPFIVSILNDEPQEEILQVEVTIPTLEPTPILPKPEDEPFMGEFTEQENEYTQMLAEAKASNIKPIDCHEYDHEAVLEMISQDETLQLTAERAKAKGTPIDTKYTEGTFIYIIKSDSSKMEKYRAIISKIAAA